MRIKKTARFFIFSIALAGAWLFSATIEGAFAAESTNPCTIQNTLPAGMNQLMSEFGDIRPGPRYHKGTDFYYNSETNWPVPPGCVLQRNNSGNLVWEQSSKKANGDPDGWGWYVVFDCGVQGGETIKMRVAHVPKQPFGPAGTIRQGCSGNAAGPNNRTGEMSHGCSRSGPHYHVEAFIGPQTVDMQCILGMEKGRGHRSQNPGCERCPNVGPADLCDASVRQQLKQHGHICVETTGIAPEGSAGDGVDPSTVQGTGPTPDPDGNTNFPDGTGDVHDTDIGGDATGGEGHTPVDIFIEPGVIPPPVPPTPDVPSNPGDEADLIIEPEDPVGPVSGCSTAVWTAMVNRSVIETRREDVVNKRFIIKPDSVLDYTCFEHIVSTVGEEAGPIFSETEKWANLDVDLIGKTVTVKRRLGTKSLDNALMSVVEAALTNYKNGQFNNDFLADSTPVSGSAGSTYCDVMANVWKAAKCRNFGDFYTFQDLGAGQNITSSPDPREFPNNMKCDF